jgi:glucan phosphorylase
MHMADLTPYVHAHEALGALYADKFAWTRKAILNVAVPGSSQATARLPNTPVRFGKLAHA